MGYFDSMIQKIQLRRERDKVRFETLDDDLCMLCGAYGPDKRNLVIECFYDVSEAVPEAIDLGLVDVYNNRGWYLRVCKNCRGEFLDLLADWRKQRIALRNTPKDHDGYID